MSRALRRKPAASAAVPYVITRPRGIRASTSLTFSIAPLVVGMEDVTAGRRPTPRHSPAVKNRSHRDNAQRPRAPERAGTLCERRCPSGGESATESRDGLYSAARGGVARQPRWYHEQFTNVARNTNIFVPHGFLQGRRETSRRRHSLGAHRRRPARCVLPGLPRPDRRSTPGLELIRDRAQLRRFDGRDRRAVERRVQRRRATASVVGTERNSPRVGSALGRPFGGRRLGGRWSGQLDRHELGQSVLRRSMARLPHPHGQPAGDLRHRVLWPRRAGHPILLDAPREWGERDVERNPPHRPEPHSESVESLLGDLVRNDPGRSACLDGSVLPRAPILSRSDVLQPRPPPPERHGQRRLGRGGRSLAN